MTSTTDDPWIQGRTVADWEEEFHQLRPKQFRGRTTEAWVGPIQVVYTKVDGAFNYVSGRAWANAVVFHSLLPKSCVYYGGRLLPTNTVLTQRWSGIDARVTCSRTLEAFTIAVDETFLQHYAVLQLGRQVFADKGNAVICANDPKSVGALQRAAIESLRSLLADPASPDEAQRRTLLQQSLMRALVDILGSDDRARSKLPHPSTRTYIVNRAIEFIEARIADEITVLDVCSAVRVCERTLRDSFATVLGVSPTQYLRARRLNLARQELLSGSQRSIKSIAIQCGFWHMGRFAQYYHSTFGQLPSNTVSLAQGARSEMPPNAPLHCIVEDALPA